MSSRANDNNPEEEKLEDIMRSIRGIINNDNNHARIKALAANKRSDPDDSILDLTDELGKDANLVSNEALNKSSATIKDFMKKLDTHSYPSATSLDIMITELITPLLKEWIDNNLPRLVEKIITEELKKLVPKV